jgi:hypothetical protein
VNKAVANDHHGILAVHFRKRRRVWTKKRRTITGAIAADDKVRSLWGNPSARNSKDTHYKQLNGLVKVLHTIEMISLAYSFSSEAFPQYPATHGAVPKYIRKTCFEGIS